MKYVDGFVIAIPKRKLALYRRIAAKAGRVWKDHGAIEYRECRGEDLNVKFGVAFPKLAKAKGNETVYFSWITYKSRKHRDQVNKKVMKDPRLAAMMQGENMPFDMKRMAYGGFDIVVDA